MKKNAVKITIFILLVLLMLGRIYDVLRWKDTHGAYLSSVEQLDACGEADIDAVFVGSSHVYAGIYPQLMWQSDGIAAFNLAISGMDRDSAYYYLKYFFKEHSAKVVVVDLYCLSFEVHEFSGNIYRNYLSLPLNPDTYNELSAYAARDERVSENMADYIARWPIIHTRYRELKHWDFVPYAVNGFGKGEYLSWQAREAEAPELSVEPQELDGDKQQWLDSICELCESAGAVPVFMALPFNNYDEDEAIIDAVGKYCAEKGVDFFDFNRMIDELSLNYSTDFSDDSHLNALGAEKISAFFAEYLKGKYTPEDHRGDPQYATWDEDLKYYYHRMYADAIKEEMDLDEFTELLKQSDGLAAVISLEGGYTLDDYYEGLAALGMSEEDYLHGGKWLYRDGVLTKICENDVNAPEYTLELDEFATLHVRYDGDFAGNNVLIERRDYSNKELALSVVVYDYYLHNILCAQEFKPL